MSAPVHFKVEVFYEAMDGPACGGNRRGRLTDEASEVTCRQCRELCGIEEPVEGLTEVHGDPFRKAA